MGKSKSKKKKKKNRIAKTILKKNKEGEITQPNFETHNYSNKDREHWLRDRHIDNRTK